MSKVGIVMGSDSDLLIMKDACDVLEQFGVQYDLHIYSAHRVARETSRYAREAMDQGVDVIIAGAGGAAHLPGVIASRTILPVIGVPIKTSTLSGVDSLYSIVQMPKGVPVATVAINGSANAAILAIQMMALKDDELRHKLVKYRGKVAEDVLEKDKMLNEIGIQQYLKLKEEQQS
ncbi:MAG: 5-(carboxyamino)imidazole ribonucleotide mutase [Bacillota bacterium]|nr:5-(carboxyamino)imidazole ribonucleotide mutase [Bacillota bacterium]